MSEPWTFLYAEEANPDLGEVALLPGYRVTFRRRGLPDLEEAAGNAVPRIVWQGVAPPPEAPFKGDQAHAVVVRKDAVDGVRQVLLRRQRRGGESGSPSGELMERVREAAARCGFPLAWLTEGLSLDRVEANFGKAVAVRVRSVAERGGRGRP